MNREAAEIDGSILELLAPGASLSKNTHTNMTNYNFSDQVSNFMYYSQDSSCTERSNPDTNDIIDEQQNFISEGNNDAQLSEAINSLSVDLSSFQVTTTQRGGVCLMEGNLVYTRHRAINNKVLWQCIQRVIWKARIHTCGGEIVGRMNEHTQEANSDIFHCSKLKAGMKRSASLSQVGTHTILTNSMSELDQGSAVKLPKLNSLKQTVRRTRKRAANVLPEPNSLNFLEFPTSYCKTNEVQPFHHYDPGVDSGT